VEEGVVAEVEAQQDVDVEHAVELVTDEVSCSPLCLALSAFEDPAELQQLLLSLLMMTPFNQMADMISAWCAVR
jgi:hypothetical protein